MSSSYNHRSNRQAEAYTNFFKRTMKNVLTVVVYREDGGPWIHRMITQNSGSHW